MYQSRRNGEIYTKIVKFIGFIVTYPSRKELFNSFRTNKNWNCLRWIFKIIHLAHKMTDDSVEEFNPQSATFDCTPDVVSFWNSFSEPSQVPFRNSNLGGCDGNENAACEEFLDGLLRCLTQQLHVKDSLNHENMITI